MGKLIDADKLITKIEEIYDGYMLSEDCGVVPKDFVEFLEEAPTVEAIPKADYENRLKVDTMAILDKIEAEIANHLQIMDICDVEKVNGVIVQSELTNRKVVLYDSVMRIIDKYKAETEQEDGKV